MDSTECTFITTMTNVNYFQHVGKFMCLVPIGSVIIRVINPKSPNSDLSQISHCIIKGLSVKEDMRIENMITQVKFL